MGDHLVTALVSILTAIVGLAIIATLVSKNANTSGVLNSLFSGFGQDIGVAVSPVTGSAFGSNFSNNSLSFQGY